MGFCPFLSDGVTPTYVNCPEDTSCKLWNEGREDCGLLSIEPAGSSGGSVPKAAMLINEYMGREDLDGNDMVYGFDFFIVASDRPPMLASMPTGGMALSWEQYLATLAGAE